MVDANPYNRQVIAEFRAHGGAVGGLQHLSLLLLRHAGARTGVERVTPLAYWPVTRNSVAVLASNFGAPRHPAWYYNLVAGPDAVAEIGSAAWAVRARVAAPAERSQLIDRISAISPEIAAAVSHSTRQIPVLILELLRRLDGGDPRSIRPGRGNPGETGLGSG